MQLNLPLIPLILASLLTKEPSMNYSLIEDKSELTILNSDLKERKTSKIRLENGLEALLISDPKADKSSASVSVAAGSWDDPEDYPGMAHFCEHMLFLGTAKFPDPNEFMSQVSDFGGVTNAFTQPHQTVYMFSCKHDGYLQNLDRFSHFFIDPIFDQKFIARELHAVDQEYSKNLENDRWREYMVFKELSHHNHPNRKFSTGNSETLSGIPSERLKQWHREHYNADRIKVFLYSPLSLEELEKLTIEHFKDVPNKGENRKLRSKTPILTEETQRKIVYIEPVTQEQLLTLAWELPLDLSIDTDRSADLVAYVLNRGQKHNLCELLKEDQLANSLQFRVDSIGGKENRFFYLYVDLTEKGVNELKTVIKRCFQSIEGLKQTNIPQSLFEEKNKISRQSYEFQSRSDAFALAQKIGGSLSNEDMATYPREQILAKSFNPSKISQTLSLLNPDTCYISLSAPSSLTKIKPDRKEKWFQTEYAIVPIEQEWIKSWKEVSINPKIQVPTANPFVAEELSLRPISDKPFPELLASTERGTAYYSRCSEYFSPDAVFQLHIKTPLIKPDAKSNVLVSIYLDHLTDLLHPTIAAASGAGLIPFFYLSDLKLNLQITGFSPKAPALLNEILKQMPLQPPTKDQFSVYYERHKKDFQNAGKSLPLVQAKQALKSLITNTQFTSQEKLQALEEITFDEFLKFHADLFKNTYTEAFFSGNLTLEEAQSSWLDVQHILGNGAYPENERAKVKVLCLDEKGPYKIEKQTEAGGNATILCLDAGTFSYSSKAALEVLNSALREAFFHELRTKQKTGYIAHSEPIEKEERLFYELYVQSNSHEPEDLLYRFELFLESYLDTFNEKISIERFETLKQSQIHSLKTFCRNLKDQSALWDFLAFEKEANFHYLEHRIEAIEKLSYEELKAFAISHLSRKNPKRLAILFKGKIENGFEYKNSTEKKIQTDLECRINSSTKELLNTEDLQTLKSPS
jgi:insulysin